jgi:DNA-binding response OmpR family regulator
MQKTIILIEDELTSGMLIKSLLKGKGFEVTWLKTYDDTFEYLSKLKISETDPVVAVVLDYRLDDGKISIPLLEILLDMGYSGPIIANSSEDDHNKNLIRAGCTCTRPDRDKVRVVEYITDQVLA